jgi:hypothetical protein
VQFLPPASVGDFQHAARSMAAEWNDFVRSQLERLLEAPSLAGHSFFVPDGGEPASSHELVWQAFPGAIDAWFRHDPDLGDRTPRAAADEAADALVPMVVGFRRETDRFSPVVVYYRQQDEYCEWRAELDDDQRVRRVTFTAESPEYWTFLESMDPSLRLSAAVYTKILDEAVMPGELSWPYDVLVPSVAEPTGWAVRFPAYTYNPWNDRNVGQGIVHCTHPDNTLMKAAMLVASASILRHTAAGDRIDDAFGLVCAGGFGDPNRLSDPAIGHFINQHVRLGQQVSVADPVGLYMRDLQLGGFAASAGKLYWRCKRGQRGRRMLRAVLEAPDGHILLDGEPVRRGGEVARRLRMTSAVLLRPRPEGESAPESLAAVAECLVQPGRPEYYGVFFPEWDWRGPWVPDAGDSPAATLPRVPATAPAFGPAPAATPATQGARLDGRTLHDIARDAALDGRWSRWSRWSLLAGGIGVMPTRWSGTG